jgi:probable addiction module antidote protein
VKTTYAPFDAADYLDNDVVIAEYLTAAAEDPNPEVFLAALGDVAKAKGMAQIAKDAGLGRESLYKTFGAGAHPRYETVSAVLRALGVKLTVSVVAEKRRPTRDKISRTRVTARPPKQRQRTAAARG